MESDLSLMEMIQEGFGESVARTASQGDQREAGSRPFSQVRPETVVASLPPAYGTGGQRAMRGI
jgi:hypothetical protein